MEFRYSWQCGPRNRVTVNCSRELPGFPETWHRRGRIRQEELFSRLTHIALYAEVMARMNMQCFHVEQAGCQQTMEQFLRSVVVIEGLESVLRSRRYSIDLQLSTFHDPAAVAQRLAALCCEYFYPELQPISDGDERADHDESARSISTE